jgi:hypothetical protein
MLEWLARLPLPVETWTEQLLALAPNETAKFAAELVRAWALGDLERALNSSATELSALRHQLAATVSALEAAGFELEYVSDELPVDDAAARRWCWIVPWLLMEQDEDLLLMEEKFFPGLLDECAAGCPKREYVLDLVSHAVRDDAHATVGNGALRLREHLAQAAEWVVPARRAQAKELAEYCERLTSYARLRVVDAEEAAQRGRDLRRCSPPPSAPHVERRGPHWLVDISSSRPCEEALVIEVSTGMMSRKPWPNT